MNSDASQEELGDVIFAIVNLARHLGIDPESSLQAANEKFASRFRAVEAQALAEGVDMRELPLEKLDLMWDAAKSREKKNKE